MNAIDVYRVGNWCQCRKIPLLAKLCEGIIRVLYNSVIYCDCSIGKNTKLAYGGIAVVIHRRSVIGSGVVISQCVTIGGRSGIKELPVIEDGVYVGAGAKILGGVRVGKDAVVGAGAVVISDVPPGSTVVGVPARILKKD